MTEKDLKRLIDALENRVRLLEESEAFKDREIERLQNEVDRLNVQLMNASKERFHLMAK